MVVTCTYYLQVFNFNTSYVLVLFYKGSEVAYAILFQYILCFGSIETKTFLKIGLIFQYILCFGSIGRGYQIVLKDIVFQYILCFGSIYGTTSEGGE